MVGLKKIGAYTVLAVFILTPIVSSIAQTRNLDNFNAKGGAHYIAEIEYVSGFNTAIEAYSLRLGYGSKVFKNGILYGVLDISSTNGFREEHSNPRNIRLNAESFGLGTSFLLQWHPVRFGNLSLFINIGGGIRYTFKSFPPEGTKLNFTARPGGGIAFHLSKDLQLLAGANRFHLSNGQGYHQSINPTFNGLGLFLGVTFRDLQN